MKKITLAVLALGALAPFLAFAEPLEIVRASAPGSGPSGSQSLSSDGKFLAFSSTSANLIASDTNEVSDIFVRRLSDSALQCVSKSAAGVLGNFASTNPSISADGRYVAFQSAASNLVERDTNAIPGVSNGQDIFVYDRTLETIKRVSLYANGGQTTQDSEIPSISGDGSFVAFASKDPNLAGATTGASSYIYIVATANAGNFGSVVRVPLPLAPDYASRKCLNPSISKDGNFVAYEFEVRDGLNTLPQFFYTDIYVYNKATNQNIRITGNSATDGIGWSGKISLNPSISADGSLVAFESNVLLTSEKNDAPQSAGFADIYVARVANSVTFRLASKDALGTVGSSHSTIPAISDDGRSVSFQSSASNFKDGADNGFPHIYRKDLATGELTLVANTQGSNALFDSSISADGSRVSFLSNATDLIPGDSDSNSATDVFLATFPKAPAVLAFDENGSATSMVDVTGSYTGRFPGSRNPFTADVAMDESGKVMAMGTVDGYTHPKKGAQLRVTGALKTVNNTPTISGTGNVKGGTLDGEPISGSGKISVPLMEKPATNGTEYPAAVGSGSAMVNGERYKQPPSLVSVPAQPANISRDWSLKLSISEKTDKKGQKYLAASATLFLPNGDQTQFKERRLTLSPKTGTYSANFSAGIKLDEALEPVVVKGKPVIDRKSRVAISNMQVEEAGDPRQPTGGQMSYKFLGQKGSGDLLEFL